MLEPKRCIDYEYAELLRSEIDEAPYNPRRIKDKNRANLKKSLGRFGIVESIVVNKRTPAKGWSEGSRKTLVGGHQRIAILDEKNKTQEYIVGVNLIDVDEAEEKALNIALNSKNLQGEYDEEMLKQLSEEGLNLEKDGFFDKVDMEMMFGFQEDVQKSIVDDDYRAAVKRNNAARENQDDGNNYDRVHDLKKVTIVFETNRNRETFDSLGGFERGAPFIRGEELISMLTEWKRNAAREGA